MTKLQTKMTISRISRIRARNNLLWMRLLALAIEARPRQAKEIIQKISKNDMEVTKWLSRV